jgi:CRISPR-associated endonuclease Csn1
MRVLGLDAGIASLGWAVIEILDGVWTIVAAGVRTFSAPVIGGKGEDKHMPLAAHKRQLRAAMRRHRRKAAKMNQLRRILFTVGLLPSAAKSALAEAQERVSPRGQKPQVTPYTLRTAGLSRRLTQDEFAVVLGSFVARPGFKPGAKLKGKNEADENNKILKASKSLRTYMNKGFRTIGQMIAEDEEFRVHKRNKRGDYSHTPTREELHDEIRILFNKQREYSNKQLAGEDGRANNDLRDAILALMDKTTPAPFDYFPVGPCRFEKGEKRAARRSPSFELFRLLARLIHLRVVNSGVEQNPSRQQIEKAIKLARDKESITFKDLRQLWELPDLATFKGLKNADDREEEDIAERNGAAMHGTKILRELLSGLLLSDPRIEEILDEVAWIVTFATSEKVAARDLQSLKMPEGAVEILMKAYGGGQLNKFTRAGHISAKACRRLNALLPTASDLREAETLLYGDAPKAPQAEPIRNPVTRRIVKECREQVEAIIREYGTQPPIDRIHVEFARDVTLSAQGRQELEAEQNKLNAQKKTALSRFKNNLETDPKGNQLLMFTLAEEQGWKCFYTGRCIKRAAITSDDNKLQIDHILPRWRSGMMRDRNNLTLCLAGANQDKADSTPYEWFHHPRRRSDWTWTQFEQLVKSTKTLSKKKRRFLLLEDSDTLKKGFRKRSLVDTQHAARLIPNELRRHLATTFGDTFEAPKIIARPAKLVSWMRHSWGVDDLKHLGGERTSDDRHHAVDAIVIAAMTDRILVRAIEAAKRNERSGRPRFHFKFDPPWSTFGPDARAARDSIFVSRAMKTDFSGRLHKDTTYALASVIPPPKKSASGKSRAREEAPNEPQRKVVERKPTEKLEAKDLVRLKDRERNHRLATLLEAWIADGKPKDRFPRWKYKDADGTTRYEAIRKVSLLTNDDPALTPKRLICKETNEAFASFDRGEMARVDVFTSIGPKGNRLFRFVPIYPDQIARLLSPLDRAVTRGEDLNRWERMDETWQFSWSLNPFSYVQLTDEHHIVRSGYFRQLNINDACIILSCHSDARAKSGKIGTRKLLDFKKFTVDRLGRRNEVPRELRTWRGKVCM